MNTVKKQNDPFDSEASNDDKEKLFNKITERKSQEIIIALVGPVASGVSTCSTIISNTLEN
ncbi:MAG: hypothetical protein ABF459_12325, partial [Gluconobacter cerinus]|uniref:hypothetical protein n=1 Tax=Gluconobacter cerinus TaxID=38307 RepID=UPI0039EC50D7